MRDDERRRQLPSRNLISREFEQKRHVTFFLHQITKFVVHRQRRDGDERPLLRVRVVRLIDEVEKVFNQLLRRLRAHQRRHLGIIRDSRERHHAISFNPHP